MSGTDTAAMVPGRFDCVIDGHGYVFWRALQQSLPFRNQRAAYSYTPTFIARTNVSGAYGDNQQDFFLTVSQDNWSDGEQLKFFRTDSSRSSRYWQGAAVDVLTEGQAMIRPAVKTVTAAAAIVAAARYSNGDDVDLIEAASATTLYNYRADGTNTSAGAHGLGVAPATHGMVTDSLDLYMSSEAAGTVGVRKFDGTVFSTFSANGASLLEFNNNTLYGFRLATADLVQYSTAGVLSTIFTWKDSDGGARQVAGYSVTALRAFGGSILILWGTGQGRNGSELWKYDGTNTNIQAAFPANFIGTGLEVQQGVVYVAGSFVKAAAGSPSNIYHRPAVFSYLSGTIELVWQANAWSTTSYSHSGLAPHPQICAFDSGLVITDDTTTSLLFLDVASGGVSTIGAYSATGSVPTLLTASTRFLLHSRNAVGMYLYPDTSTVASAASVTSSLFDLDNSLTKTFRGVKVDFTAATDGDGGTVDISYRVGDVDGSYTSLQTGAVSGTEYALTSVSGRALSVKVTLNKSTSTLGPVLKRVYVRAAPVQQAFRRTQYVLDCTGVLTGSGRANPVRLGDGTDSTLTGAQLAANLNAAISSTAPITITDRFGTFTGVLEPGQCELDEVKPDEFIAQISAREV